MQKQKYKGTFNWNGELIVLWTHAFGERGAKWSFIIQLAKKLFRTQSSLRGHYSTGKPNHEIEEII